MRNLELNKTSPSSLAQKLTELRDFKNEILKKVLFAKMALARFHQLKKAPVNKNLTTR